MVDDWKGVELWLGDERLVPPDNPETNYRLVAETLLQSPGRSRTPSRPAARRRRRRAPTRARSGGASRRRRTAHPTLDLALLGLGEDGHVASLFPNAPALDARGEICVAVHEAPKPPPDRVSLTLDVLRAARSAVILAVGEGKASAAAGGPLRSRSGRARQPPRRRAAGADPRPSRRARAPRQACPDGVTRSQGGRHRHPAHPTRRLERAAGPPRRDPGHAPAHAVRRGPRPRRADDRRGRRPYLDYSKNRVTDETLRLLAGWPRSAECPSAARRCSAASGSTSPRAARSCTWRCGCRAIARSSSTASTSSRRSTEVLDRMGDFCERVRGGRVARPHRQADPQRGQHRDRRLGPGARDGVRGAAPLLDARDGLSVRLQRRRHRLRRGDPRPRPRGDAVRRLLEDLHHAGDDDQCPHRARVGPGRPRATRPRSRSTSSPSRPTPRGSRSSASTPTTCSAFGTGSAVATRWTRRSGSRPCWRSGPSGSRRCWPASTPWTSTSSRRRSSATSRRCWGCSRFGTGTSSAPRRSRSSPTTSTCTASRPISSS